MKKQRLFFLLLVLTILGSRGVFADEAASQGESSDAAAPESRYMEMRQRLWELKKNDPEAFRAKISELRSNAQERLDRLKESNPQAYDRVLERRQRRIAPRFERMRQENPEAYERVRDHRKGLIRKRMEWLRDNEPEKFDRLKKRWEAKKAARAEGRASRNSAREERPRVFEGRDLPRRNPGGYEQPNSDSGPNHWKRPERPAARRAAPARRDGR